MLTTGHKIIPGTQVIDSLVLAREKYPGSPASLDALCRRFSIDNSNRDIHGALLDSYLLAQVYLELIGGRQPNFELDNNKVSTTDVNNLGAIREDSSFNREKSLPIRLKKEETIKHKNFIEGIGGLKNWSNYT